MVNETILQFGYPDNVLKEYDHWVVLLRPKQVTAGSMVLACKEEAESLSAVSVNAYSELPAVTGEMEKACHAAFQFEKINYVLLMMVDKYVHFHVLPRYGSDKEAAGATFVDKGWPKHPDMTSVTDLTAEQFRNLRQYMLQHWPR